MSWQERAAAINVASILRERAAAAHERAKKRGDTQAIHSTREALKAATLQCLRLGA